MNLTMRIERLEIPLDHPVFAGHFPGLPLLPGSLLLDWIVAAWSTPVARVSRVKFLRPVAPGDVLMLTFTPAAAGSFVHFDCLRGEDRICSGRLLPKPQRR